MSSLPASAVKNSGESALPVAALASPRISISSANLRIWGKKSALSLVDQALTSGAGFAVNLVLARWLNADQYGAFAVAFAVYLFISGFHNVLLLEPLSVIGPSRYAAQLPRYFRAQLEVHGVLVWPLVGFLLLAAGILSRLAPNSPLIGALIGGGIALPFLLLLWLARRMCYVLQRPGIAILGSGLYLAFALGGLALLRYSGHVSPMNAFIVSGLGSLAGTAVVFHRLGLRRALHQDIRMISWRKTLIENWTYGRWLVGSTILFSASSQAQTFLVAASLGLGAAGILRAMQIPSLAMTQVVTATGLLVLPTLSHDYGRGLTGRMRHKAILVSVALVGVTLCFAALLTVASARIGNLLYGGKYVADVWLMPVLALIPVVNGASMGFSMALRASQQPRFDLVSNLFAAPVAIVSAFLFIRLWGLTGAAVSMLLSFVVLFGVTLAFFRKSTHERASAEDFAEGLP